MAQLRSLSTSGLSAVAAQAINGDAVNSLTATGSTQADALALPAANNFISTAAASTGVILPAGNAGDCVFVYNGGASTETVYPPVGGTINNLSANTGLALATLKSGWYVYRNAITIASMLSA